jgi:cysteine desulfurase / selenocysteine lyase
LETKTNDNHLHGFQNSLSYLFAGHHHHRGVGVCRAMSAAIATARTASKVIHLNHAGASIMPRAVLDCMAQYQRLEQRVGGYAAAEQCHEQLQQVYRNAATLIHATRPELEIALVESATVAWTRLFYSYCAAQQDAKKKKKKKIILVSEAEYAANLVAACQWARTHTRREDDDIDSDESWSVLAIPSSALVDDDYPLSEEEETDADAGSSISTRKSTGKVNLNVLETMLSGKYMYQSEDEKSNEPVLLDPTEIALVCITHIPTNSGIINPVNEIGNMIAKFNEKHAVAVAAKVRRHHHHHHQAALLPSILYLVDACQSVGQIDVNVQAMKCHGLVATGRKYLRGPRGTGFLYIPASIVDSIWPHHVDHYSVPIRAVPNSQHVVVKNVIAAAAVPGPVPVESFLDFAPRPGATRFEFYESNIGNKLGLGMALRQAAALREENGEMSRQNYTHSVAMYLYEKLNELAHRNNDGGPDGVRLHYKPECGIVTFWIHGCDAADVKRLLSQSVAVAVVGSNDNDESVSFEVSVVPATSTPLDSARTGVPDLLRASVSYTSTRDEVDLFCDRLTYIVRHELCEER